MDTPPPRDALPHDEAARALTDALALRSSLREPGQRDAHRALLLRAVGLADALRDVPDARVSALATLAHAHAARADDALHGARQLSLSAQRAPTPDDCDDGWRRVGELVGVAVTAARASHEASDALAKEAVRPAVLRRSQTAAQRAATAARDAQQLVATRNDAYTFHTDGEFSFGEGWHVAAAAVLAGVAVQVEPGGARAAQSERFLRDAGLGDCVQPYRARPRAAKQTTAVVARAFRDDADAAQRALRMAFLGDAGAPREVAAWADARMGENTGRRAVLLWVRDGSHHPGRNTDVGELATLAMLARDVGLTPIVLGEALPDDALPDGAVDLTRFSRDAVFAHDETRRSQLWLFEHLRRAHGLVGQVGVTTAGMDGPALLGLATMYLTDAPNPRMRAWVGAVPGYTEVLRDEAYLARVHATLRAWAVG